MSSYKVEERIDEVLESLGKSRVEEPPQIVYEVVNAADMNIEEKLKLNEAKRRRNIKRKPWKLRKKIE